MNNCIAACKTDNAHNIVNVIDLYEWRHVDCFSHSLNLAVEIALKSIFETVKKLEEF